MPLTRVWGCPTSISSFYSLPFVREVGVELGDEKAETRRTRKIIQRLQPPGTIYQNLLGKVIAPQQLLPTFHFQLVMHAPTLRTHITHRVLPRPYVYVIKIAALALAGGLSRIVFVRPTPVNWDAVQFALAVQHFDLHAHQPHPPGYILYVLLGRLLDAVVGNPSVALSFLSVLFSMAALPLMYGMCHRIFEESSVALGAAVLMLGSPLALYYGSTGLTYVPEMTLGIAVAWLAWNARQERTVRLAIFLGMTLGMLSGVRQTGLPLLMALCVWALWSAPRKLWLAFGLSLIGACLLWGVPLVAISGGLEAYLRENSLLAQEVPERTSILGAGVEGVLLNMSIVGLSLVVGVALAIVPLGLWALRMVRFSLSPSLKGFLLWWAVPPLMFFSLSHIGQSGYVLLVLPPILMLAAICTAVTMQRIWGDTHKAAAWGSAACLGLAVLSASYFLLAPAQAYTSASAIVANDRHWKEVPVALQAMDPQYTVLVMSLGWYGPFRHAGYLLSQYHAYAGSEQPGKTYGWLYSAYSGQSSYSLPEPPASPTLELPPHTEWVVALDRDTGDRLEGEKGLSSVSLADGSTLYVLHVPGAQIARLRAEGEKIKAIYTK